MAHVISLNLGRAAMAGNASPDKRSRLEQSVFVAKIMLDRQGANPYSSAPLTSWLTRGEVSEWLKEHAWKVCIRESVSRVRIPPSPPEFNKKARVITRAFFIAKTSLAVRTQRALT